MEAGMIIRPATQGDAEALAAIYGHAVLHGFGTFETTPPTAEEMDRLRSLLDAGKTAREIAVEIDRTPNAIHGLLQRHYRKQDPQRPDETRRG